MLTSGGSAATILFAGDGLPALKNFQARYQFQNTLIRDSRGAILYNMADLSKTRGRRVVEPLVNPAHNSAFYRRHHEDWLVGPHGQGIPVVLQNATIATEDATFYSNPGFDPLSMARASYQNFTQGRIVSGASTITQQLVKEYMLSPDPSLSRKAEEIFLAAELTRKYPKSRILYYYLNSIPYGTLSVGAEAASETYFNKFVWQLDLAQCALLAGLPEGPSIYNPVNNLPAALDRMHYVLHLMYMHGFLRDAQGRPDPALIDKAMAEARTWKFSVPVTHERYPHFVDYAIQQLRSIRALQGKIYNGLDVYTTIDPRLQDAAQATVKDQVSQLAFNHVTDGALVSMDLRPQYYGWVRAMVGSADYNNAAIAGQINMADTPRQPGSSFKPFNYIYAFENGLSPATTVLDGPLAIPDPGNPADGGVFAPEDYDHSFHGTVTLRVALQNSLNVPAVRVEQFSGVNNVAHMAMKMGIKSLRSDNPQCCGWALTLGGMERGVRLVEETSAYGVFASGGHTVPPIAIARVYDRTTGKLLYDWRRDGPKPQMVLKSAGSTNYSPYAYIMNNVLSDNTSRCLPQVCEFGTDSPLNLGRTAAAKTGTTNAFTDNWTVGYTPQILTGVWVGNADSSAMVGTTGITGAAPIWHDYMLQAFNILNLPPVDFPQPDGVYLGSECRLPGNYDAFSYFNYDVYAGTIPYCTVGAQSQLSVPQAPQSYQAPSAPVAPSQPAAPQPTAVPQQVVPTQPALPQPTQPAQQPVTPQQPAQLPPASSGNSAPPGTVPP